MIMSELFTLVFPDDFEQELMVTQLAERLYRLEETPVFCELDFSVGDVIEADLEAEKCLRFRRLAEPSPLVRSCWTLSRQVADSQELQHFLDEVLKVGGAWERNFVGVLHLYLPPDTTIDPASRLEQMVRGTLTPSRPVW